MKCVLFALALVCAAQAIYVPQPMKDMDVRKLAGKWHTMAMASNDMSLLNSEEAPMKVFINKLTATPEGNMEVTLSKWVNHKCVEITILAQKTQDPAVFMIDYEGQKITVTVVDTDIIHYMYFCMNIPMPSAKQATVCQYTSRTMDPSEEYLKKFDKVLEAQPMEIQIYLNLAKADGITKGEEDPLTKATSMDFGRSIM
ncbi:beta-lactoglobulin-2-like [Erinaceus europaeus]|uniref:Beta-lactoglobulin-2-like n=1 Tax=Erinaceus europaeus TaxID=9365 RepID=A0ABM3Y1N6_ERIEU|nr:beta-lactoglobulin-2-like [Erinaceus europaeus]